MLLEQTLQNKQLTTPPQMKTGGVGMFLGTITQTGANEPYNKNLVDHHTTKAQLIQTYPTGTFLPF